MLRLTPTVSVLLPDQHEDDACRDVQAADGARDAHLHLESRHWAGCRPNNERRSGWMARWGGMEGCDADNLFFYHLFLYFFAASCCNAVKNIRFLCSGFYLCLTLS